MPEPTTTTALDVSALSLSGQTVELPELKSADYHHNLQSSSPDS